MIFIHLITANRPENINSEKKLTGNSIPQFKSLMIKENPVDK